MFASSASKPIEAIEAIIALTMFSFGLYVVSPWYMSTSTSAVGAAFSENLAQQVFVGVLFFMIPATPILLGLFWKKFHTATWRARSNFAMFFGLTFLTILRLIVIGPYPATWIFSLAMGLVSAVCYLFVRLKA